MMMTSIFLLFIALAFVFVWSGFLCISMTYEIPQKGGRFRGIPE
jgi:hypothetical protein